MLLLITVLACTESPDGYTGSGQRGDFLDTDLSTDWSTSDTGGTSGSSLSPTSECSFVPAIGPVSTLPITSQGSFDFEPSGMLLTAAYGNLRGVQHDGSFEVWALDPRAYSASVRVLPSGEDFVISDRLASSLTLVTQDGVVGPVMSDLTEPLALAADSSGSVYVLDGWDSGRILVGDLVAGTQRVVVEHLEWPTALALSPDEQTLYFAEGHPSSSIFSAKRNGNTFRNPRLLQRTGTLVVALATDSCGYIYALELEEIYRISPDGASIESITNLPGYCCYVSMRFGNGVGGFDRDHLYVTARDEVYDVPVRIPGKAPIYPVP